MFGSAVVAQLSAAGHETALIPSLEQLPPGAFEVLVIDLTAEAPARLRALERADIGTPRTIGVYAHVEVDVRRAAERAGLDLVVPRSRFAREGAELVTRLSRRSGDRTSPPRQAGDGPA